MFVNPLSPARPGAGAARTSRRPWYAAGVWLLLSVLPLQADAPRTFRTDTDPPPKPAPKNPPKGAKGAEKPLDWFQLQQGQFPPEGSAHAIPGELLLADHLERRFQIRVDRNDSQERGVWDRPLEAVLLPYASLSYRGAPAALQDIPVGTHLQGLFYVRDPSDKKTNVLGPLSSPSPEQQFGRCFRLEDDFSVRARLGELWKIENVDLDGMKLTAVLEKNDAPVDKPRTFDLLPSTWVVKDKAFAELTALAPGQKVNMNFTWVTLYGPGRVTEIWVDAPSRAVASTLQLEKHRNYIRQRGLPGWVREVDDEAQILTITFFEGVDPKLFEEVQKHEPAPPPPPPVPGTPATPPPPRSSVAVAKDTLNTYDPVNDRKAGDILEVLQVPREPGSSGVQIKIKMDMLLEGYRPRRVVRVYPPTWKVIAVPKEESEFGRD